MANEYLTVQQAQYLLSKWASEYVPNQNGILVSPTLNRSISIGGTPTFDSNATRDSWVSALSIIGSVANSNADNISVASSTNVTLCNTGSLAPAIYLFFVDVNFPSNNTGRRGVFLSWSDTGSAMDRYSNVNVPPVNGDTTRVLFSVVQNITSTSTAYLRVWQNSGSTMSVGGGIRRIRLRY